MCGIAGSISLSASKPIRPAQLRAMADALQHRGPDDQGFHVDPQQRCGLAFRRLAIIDLATGNQPLCNEDGSVWVAFNGEIYNFRELRADLERAGHRFATQSDTEVIVHLYEEHGPGCFQRLAGMFAIAIWDERGGELLLARDRLGKKPLTYCIQDGQLYFASEAKAILALPEIERRLDPRALQKYLTWQYVAAPHSIFVGFGKLVPGCYLRIPAGKPVALKSEAYWRPPARQHFDGDFEDAKRELGVKLEKAVARRLISDVPLGAFLSGGIDSSIVAGLMRKLGVSPLRTFSIGFPDARYDETAAARDVAQAFQTEHHEHVVTPQAQEILETLAYHYDEPFGDSSAIPTYYVSQYTRQSVTVALTGDGGDECFAGYDRYRGLQIAARMDWLPSAARAALADASRVLPRGQAKSLSSKLSRFLAVAGRPSGLRYNAWVQIIDWATLRAAARPEFQTALDPHEDCWLEELVDAKQYAPAEWANRADIVSYLPYDLLTKVDIASMACSLECRAPFLDHELLEFALSLPMGWKLSGRGGKRILKDWARDLLPASILQRPKMGFGVPVGEWFRGPLKPLLKERLRATDGICSRIFQRETLNGWIEAHLAGRENFGHRLWVLLMLELWFARWRPALPWA